jgi:hypothetical protein
MQGPPAEGDAGADECMEVGGEWAFTESAPAPIKAKKFILL